MNHFRAARFVNSQHQLIQGELYEEFAKIVSVPTQGYSQLSTYQSGQSSVSLLSAKNKIDAAKKWNIPVVSIAYLWEIFEKSQYKSMLIVPELNDPQWCIHAPINYIRPKSLIEYIKSMGEATSIRNSGDKIKRIRMPSNYRLREKLDQSRNMVN